MREPVAHYMRGRQVVPKLGTIVPELGSPKGEEFRAVTGTCLAQGARLRAALSWMASRPYITQAHLHMLHDQGTERFGLTRLDPPGPITRDTRFVPKMPFYQAFEDYPRAKPTAAPTPTGVPTLTP